MQMQTIDMIKYLGEAKQIHNHLTVQLENIYDLTVIISIFMDKLKEEKKNIKQISAHYSNIENKWGICHKKLTESWDLFNGFQNFKHSFVQEYNNKTSEIVHEFARELTNDEWSIEGNEEDISNIKEYIEKLNRLGDELYHAILWAMGCADYKIKELTEELESSYNAEIKEE